MGLNDLTLEKLISEINGYKEKMRAIHEDYGRASQDLQDRINVLGYTLNEHLRETKDQIANTPQRLLNLETKYVTGEVNDSEYRSQREEFKGLLNRNLQSIEEIKSMISVLQQIEVKPLAPAEFKQSAPRPSPIVTGEVWGRGVFRQDKPFTIPQFAPSQVTIPPTNTVISTEQLGSEKPASLGTSLPASSPSPPQPQSNGNSLPELTPHPSNASLDDTVASGTPIVDTTPTITSAPTGQSVIGEAGVTDVSVDDAVTTIPTVDIVNSSLDEDALMVKVVDDIPSVGASAVMSETSSLQSPLGNVDAPTLAPVQSDLSQPGIAPPAQFYNVVCPKCGADVPKPAKVWELKGGKSKKNVLIGLFQCQDCRVKFREALTREII